MVLLFQLPLRPVLGRQLVLSGMPGENEGASERGWSRLGKSSGHAGDR